jgi:hypothetical protein
MKRKINVRAVLFCILVFAAGFGIGYFVKSELLVPSGETDKNWKVQFTEEAGHGRIIHFQNALQKPKDAKDLNELSKQLDAQLKIEDLITKSREAEYAKWIPLTALFTGPALAAEVEEKVRVASPVALEAPLCASPWGDRHLTLTPRSTLTSETVSSWLHGATGGNV